MVLNKHFSSFYQDGNYTVVELRGLFPSMTYQIMIEAHNEQGTGLEGTYFECRAPTGKSPPSLFLVQLFNCQFKT